MKQGVNQEWQVASVNASQNMPDSTFVLVEGAFSHLAFLNFIIIYQFINREFLRLGEELRLTLPGNVTDTSAFVRSLEDGLMGRVQAASLVFNDRALLSQMTIATVLVGSVAALSSAGIAVPVSKVDYTKGWSDRAPAAPSRDVVAAPAPLPAYVPKFEVAPAQRIVPPAPRTTSVLAAPAAAMSRIDAIQSPGLALASATPIDLAPGRGERAPLPLETSVALIAPPAPAAAPSAAPASLVATAPVPETAPLGAEAKPDGEALPFRLVNPPELRGFDLAKISTLPPAVPAGFAKPAAKSAVTGKVEGLGKKDTVVGDAVFHQVSLTVAGSDAKAIDVRIGADMKPSIKVGDLLGLVSDRMDPDSAARFAAAASTADFVSLATLRAAGFDVTYNAGSDNISISVAQ